MEQNPLDRLLESAVGGLGSSSTLAAFEQFIVQLLTLQAAAQGRQQPVLGAVGGGRSARARYDAVLPTGLSDLAGPTVVEVKLFRRQVPPTVLLDRVLRVLLAATGDRYASVLIIVPFEISNQYNEQFTAGVQDLVPGALDVRLWGYSELARLAAAHSEHLDASVATLTLAPLTRAAEGKPSDWRVARDVLLEELQEAYRSEGICMFLGAGVSAGSGLPEWNDLLAALFLEVFNKQLPTGVSESALPALVAAAAELNSKSPLLVARYLRRGLAPQPDQGKDQAFSMAVATALYRNLKADRATTALLDKVASLCVPGRRGTHVHSVVTYNFDDLLEEQLTSRFVKHVSVYSGDQRASDEELPVFHAHGFLPRQRDGFARLEESLLAFSEEGYHELYEKPYHWSNIAQITALRERTCILLGLSLTDPNLRRLLEISYKDFQEPRHFVFVRRAAVEEVDPEGKLEEGLIQAFLRVHHALQEQVLQELGLRVVWFERYDDLPELLGKIA